MEFPRSFLRRHFAGEPLLASRNVGCFLRLKFLSLFQFQDLRYQHADSLGAIHSTKISGNFGPKLNGSVRSNRKSFEKTGPPFEVDHFSRSDQLEFWLNGSRPLFIGLDHGFRAGFYKRSKIVRAL